MNWFRNLNATPRLMSSFGIVIALAMTLGYLGINNLGKANDRVDRLYNMDFKGADAASNLTIARYSLGRQGRDAMLKIDNAAVVAEDEKSMLEDFAKIHAALDVADKTFTTPEGKAALQAVRDALPGYEKAYHHLYERIDAHDLPGAWAALDEAKAAGTPLYAGTDKARALKEKLAEKKFQLNNQEYDTARILMICASGLTLVLGLLLSLVIAREFSLPLGRAVQALDQLAEGDLTVSLYVDTEDEVGQMANALNKAVERLNATMRDVSENAANASSSSQELASASEAIASGAQEQAASLEETSASLEQITATVRQSSDNAQQASQLAMSSRDSAVQGQEVVAQAITAMSEINTSSAKISEIISTIEEIAFQTNLLAVNAAVEAARAGDEGRGFAVVASEVRALAQRSAGAAKEIKGLIQDSLHKVNLGSALVNRSGETLQGIVGSVKRVTDIVGEMATAASEQSSGVEQVNTAMTQMDHVTQSNSAQTEELSATAESLSEQAANLLQLVGAFNLGNNGGNRGNAHTDSRLAETHRPAKAVRSKALAKVSNFANARTAKRQPAVPAMAATAPTGSSDASFEEF